jgi:hypothetical protein
LVSLSSSVLERAPISAARIANTARSDFSPRPPVAAGWIDLPTRRLLFVVLLVFGMSVSLKLNGSSAAIWNRVLHDDDAPSGLLFSTPKAVRTDEWLGWTRSLLSQALHNPSFPVENPDIGAGRTPLLVSLPALHYTMFFRPQLYGFFLFDLETAFAWFWNVKLFGLFLSFFLLLRALTRNHFAVALFGAGWVCLSAYTQWWFSCPPMLPEMLACWATAILCLIHLFRTEKIHSIVLTTLALIIAAVDYTLCFYPPFQVPLTYLGIALVATWLWQNRKSNQRWRSGCFALGLAGIIVATVAVFDLIECRSTLEVVRQTHYPGLRQSYGGDLSLKDTLNGVAGFFNSSERQYLTTRENPCEASNFYPLWLLAMTMSGTAFWRQWRQRCVEVMLLGAILVLTLYICFPFPACLCRASLFSYVTGTRVLLPIGIAGILLTTMLMARTSPKIALSKRVLISAIAIAAIGLLLLALYPGNHEFFTPPRLWGCWH